MNEAENYETLVELFDKQLEFAQTIQKKIIPKASSFKSNDYHFHAYLKPFRKVGGDFYDFYTLENDCISLIMSDATGHGIDAAMITIMIKLIYSHSMKDPSIANSPVLLLKQLESEIYQQLPTLFFTAITVVLNPKENCLHFSNAGHPPGILIHPNGDIHYLAASLPMIGLHQLMTGIKYEDIHLSFKKGDKLLLMTDGIIDGRNYSNEEFSFERILSVVKSSSDASISRICDDLITQYKNFKSGKSPSDDVCVLGIEYD